ncbi:MAG: mechanosensitive ion channel family protein [Brevefilum sp.]|nr:mechanosensitive ion channel family protein [Brevefilum sp.]
MIAEIWANDLYRKLILSALVFILQFLVRRGIDQYILKRSETYSTSTFAVRKVVRYVITILTIVVLYIVWVDQMGDISIALGIFGAGLAFALQEVIGSFAGWLTIISGKPFSIGDRIETGGIQGDVIDIGILRTTIMEIGNWLVGDHNTGRIVTLSNAFIFKEPLFSYDVHLHYIWDEIRIPLPYGSDWKKAIEILLNTVKAHPEYQKLLPKARQQREELRKQFAVKVTPLEPRVFVNLTDNWIALGLVYPVDTEMRRLFRSEISQQLLETFDTAGIEIASETISIVDFPGK